VKELVVISGKGGTGKTSIVASFSALAERKVLADCDVDAADLWLILEPHILRREPKLGGKRAQVIEEKCTSCGKCREVCRFDAISSTPPVGGLGKDVYRVDPIACEGCGVCAYFCPEEAIDFRDQVNGEWFISETRNGPMVHAKLGIAEENSGKLVTLVRKEAKRLAEERGLDLVIIDGSPGIGCPVIASLTGASLVLVVTEPTLSGQHDLERVSQLTAHFGSKTVVCINKYDLNLQMAARMERGAAEMGLKVVGKVSYDPAVTKAQIMRASVVEYTGGKVAEEIKALWRQVVYELG